MNDILGMDITVNFNDINSVNPGEEYVFFCDPYFIGNEIAVSENGRMNTVDLNDEKLSEQIAQVTQDYNDNLLRETASKKHKKKEEFNTYKSIDDFESYYKIPTHTHTYSN